VTPRAARRKARALACAIAIAVATGCGAEREREVEAAEPTTAESWVGSQRCGECHAEELAAWTGSHHELAMQPASAASVRGRFDGEARALDGETWTPVQPEPGHYRVRTPEGDGEPNEVEVAFAFGVFPLQQYLAPGPGGRLQVLPIAWDARPEFAGGQRWFHLYEGERVRAGDALHWRGRTQTWNHQCADCHATRVARGYDEATDRYATTFAEPGVGCESCHGPGGAHVSWSEAGVGMTAARDPYAARRLRGRGTWTLAASAPIATRDAKQETSNELDACAPCHSRRMPLTEGAPPRTPYLDAYLPSLLDDGLYFADGQMRDEVYVYGSFLQSRMHAAGVSCSDCHDPHTLALPDDPDEACARCHAKATFAVREHHDHDPGSIGASCVECHMPARTYMQVDARRDHSMRIPRPDVAAAIGAPDACSGCHRGTAANWADRLPAARATDRAPNEPPHFALAIARARTAVLDAREHAALVAVASDAELAPIVRASALSLVEPFRDNASLRAVENALASSDPLVRIGALRALEHVPPDARVEPAARLLRDTVRAVRTEAARVLADASPRAFPPGERATLLGPLRELRAAYEANADRAEAQLGLAALERARGDVEAELARARRARELAPHMAAATVNLADSLRAAGRDPEARALLEQAAEREPDDSALHHALGLARIRAGDGSGALAALARAVELAPEASLYAYAHALALDAAGRRNDAIAALEKIAEREPGHADALAALATFERDRGKRAEALAWAQRLAEARPDDRRGGALVEELGGAR